MTEIEFIANILKSFFNYKKYGFGDNFSNKDIIKIFRINEMIEIFINPKSWYENLEEMGASFTLDDYVLEAFKQILFSDSNLSLYYHQANFIEDVLFNTEIEAHVLSVPTATGKTEAFLFPVLDKIVKRLKKGQEGTSAIFFYPMKALEADQLNRFVKYVFFLNEKGINIDIGIWDGDTPSQFTKKHVQTNPRGLKCPKCNKSLEINEELKLSCLNHHEINFENIRLTRREIKKTDPSILITNPEALEYRLVSSSGNFRISEQLDYVILDEAHVWKGIGLFPISLLIKRIKLRSKPKFLISSATLGKDKKNLNDFISQMMGNNSFNIIEYYRRKFDPEIEEYIALIKASNYNYLIPASDFEELTGIEFEKFASEFLKNNYGKIKTHISMIINFDNLYCMDCKEYIFEEAEHNSSHDLGNMLYCPDCYRLYFQNSISNKPIFDSCYNHRNITELEIDKYELILYLALYLTGLYSKNKDKILVFSNSRFNAEYLGNKFFEYYAIQYAVVNFTDKIIHGNINLAIFKDKVIAYLIKQFIEIPFKNSRDSTMLSGYYTIFYKIISFSSTHFNNIISGARIFLGNSDSFEEEDEIMNDFFLHLFILYILKYSKYDPNLNGNVYEISDKKILNRFGKDFPFLIQNYDIDIETIEYFTNILIQHNVLNFVDTNKYLLDPFRIKLSKIEGELIHCTNCQDYVNSQFGDYCLKCGSRLINREMIMNGKQFNLEPNRIAIHKGGILAETRNIIEKSLKTNNPKINVVSTTSTLEMGIDIGDLSNMIQYDYPVYFSSYVQRVGRIGRSDIKRNLIINMVPFDSLSGIYTHELFSKGKYFWENISNKELFTQQYGYGQILSELLFALKIKNRKKFKSILSVNSLIDIRLERGEYKEKIKKFISEFVNTIISLIEIETELLKIIFPVDLINNFKKDLMSKTLEMNFIDKLMAIFDILETSFATTQLSEKALEGIVKNSIKDISMLSILNSFGWFCNYRNIGDSAIISRIKVKEDELQIKLFQSKSLVDAVSENYIGSTDYYMGASFETLNAMCGSKNIVNYSLCQCDSCLLFNVPNYAQNTYCDLCLNPTDLIEVNNYIGSIMKTTGLSQATKKDLVYL
ncbi:MAG: DEAD/DEAH box helicase [Candidatus Heimdallarchaeota archaeon]|nr:DEAD/DEAH box helicase [Candidatus Heimdallarchaeota archaeon]